MGKSGQSNYSNNVRQSAIQDVLEKNQKVSKVAESYGMDPATLYRWLQRYEKEGKAAFAPRKTGRSKSTDNMDYEKAYKAVMRFLAFLEQRN